MNYCDINTFDVTNGLGIRVSLYVSGCSHHCKGCFNSQTWNKNFGKEFGKEQEELILSYLKRPEYNGLTLLGGEPWEPYNQEALTPFLERVKSECPDKNIWSFSGYTWEELHDKNSRCYTENTDKMLSFIDVLIDGEFHEDEKDLSLVFRGSKNQRIIDVKKSLDQNTVTEYELQH